VPPELSVLRFNSLKNRDGDLRFMDLPKRFLRLNLLTASSASKVCSTHCAMTGTHYHGQAA
jgi:hypothetical protein